MRRPRFIAEQARHARGLLGRFIAFVMARETWGQNQRAIEALSVESGDHVLDVGCGPGRGLAALAERAAGGRAVGIDPSELMVETAIRRNRALVERRRVDVTLADVAALPFADGSFDKALCVHVIYFWKDRDAAFREIARVLKPGGRLALLFRTSANHAAVRAFPAAVYDFPSLAEGIGALEGAGFSVDADRARAEESGALPVLFIATKRGDPSASLEPSTAR